MTKVKQVFCYTRVSRHSLSQRPISSAPFLWSSPGNVSDAISAVLIVGNFDLDS